MYSTDKLSPSNLPLTLRKACSAAEKAVTKRSRIFYTDMITNYHFGFAPDLMVQCSYRQARIHALSNDWSLVTNCKKYHKQEM